MALEPVSFADLITFTRASSATRVNASGLIETVSSNVARIDYDPVTLAPKGLLIEEQRTNLLLRSQEFDNASWLKIADGTGSAPVVTSNDAIAPDGTATADKIVFDRGAGNTISDRSYIAQSVTTVAAATYFGGIYIKAATAGDVGKQVAYRGAAGAGYQVVTLTGDFVRVGVAEVAGGTSGTFEITNRGTITTDNSVGVHVWQADLQAGAFAASPIPTTSATVTRAADVASITGTNFSNWYNASEGTFVAEASTFKPTAVVASANIAVANNGPANERLIVRFTNGNADGAMVDGGIYQAQYSQGYTVAVPDKLAIAYAANNFAVARNGVVLGTNTSCTLPTVDRLWIGSESTIAQLNGHIRRLSFHPTRLSNALLQSLTS